MSTETKQDDADISHTLAAKSENLGADDLIAGPIVVKILHVKVSESSEQPVTITLEGRKPYAPCKTVRRLLAEAWGPKGRDWVGRSMMLVRDPTVMFKGEKVGGIRLKALSHLTRRLEIAVTSGRGGKKQLVAIDKLDPKYVPPKPTESDLDESFQAMKALWKKRRTANELSVSPQEWTIFITSATEQLVVAANVLKPTAFTPALIQKCVDWMNFEMPEPEVEA